MKSKLFAGISLLTVGLLLLAAALTLSISNMSDELSAEKSSRQAADIIFRHIEAEKETNAPFEDSSEFIEIDGSKYIGVLTIPKLSLELPVLNELSSAGLKKAPCLYSGSVGKHDLVIAAHNYSSHFGELYTLSIGDEVYFTEINGTVTEYLVAEKETLLPYETKRMTDSEYDLTLFTCTVGGGKRVTVRCERIIG